MWHEETITDRCLPSAQWHGFEVSEEAASAMVWSGAEIEFARGCGGGVVAARCGAVAGADGPEAVKGERPSARVLHQTDELTGGEIVRGDGSVPLRRAATCPLADEQGVAKDAEVEGGEGYAPGSIEPVAMFEAFEEVTIRGEDIDIAEAGTVSL